MKRGTDKALHIEDESWLRNVRADLDSSADDWVVKPSSDGISKLQALGSYLDIVLAELGHKGRLHECPECGVGHLSPRIDR